jgi:hypothetical protein
VLFVFRSIAFNSPKIGTTEPLLAGLGFQLQIAWRAAGGPYSPDVRNTWERGTPWKR